jgi:hypothetical protein
MKYSPSAHVVNALFIAFIFLGPIGYCLYNKDIPTDIGSTVIVLSFALGAFVLADWYHFYAGNSFAGIAKTIAIGIVAALGSVLAASAMSNESFGDLALFRSPHAWSDNRLLLRSYVVGVGLSAAAIVGIPRLLVITRLKIQELPTEHGT